MFEKVLSYIAGIWYYYTGMNDLFKKPLTT